MGAYHINGTGVNRDASRAYAFWELAADMGSASAQAYLGEALDAAYDSPKQGFWGNRKVGLKMLECSMAQGNPKGAFALGLSLDVTDHDYSHALKALVEAVKFGSEDAANYLRGSFEGFGDDLVGRIHDEARGKRYDVLQMALFYNPDLRFPNLDKVLPLPPTRLPKWDGDEQTLIDAAKAVIPVSSGPLATALVARGAARQVAPPPRPLQSSGDKPCPAEGIWQARVPADHPLAALFNQWNQQSYVRQGQSFPDPRQQYLQIDPQQITWTWLGQANE
jgi:hypothetical protein